MYGFEKLRIYQLALDGVERIYAFTKIKPIISDFSFIDQIRRAAMSVVANIAEGHGRGTEKDFAKFISIAIGSTNEVIAFLQISSRIYPSFPTQELQQFYHQLGKQCVAFRNTLLVFS